MDDAYIPRAQIVSVTGHRNEKSLDDYIDSFSTVCSKQLSNIISGRETVTGIETPVSFLVHPHLRWLINNCNSQFWDLGDLGAGRRTDESEKKEGQAFSQSECQKLPRICPTWICPILAFSN
jgi:hypothetical protein